MKRGLIIAAFVAVALTLAYIGYSNRYAIDDWLHPEFTQTTIYPDEGRVAPRDTVFDINGVSFRMIGVKGGKIDCAGLRETVELPDYYIAETEVTRELWSAVMGSDPSVLNYRDSLPVENVSLIDCMDFVVRLDSIAGCSFDVPSYPHWVYAAHLGNLQTAADTELDKIAWHNGNSDSSLHAVKQKSPDALGVYDMLGNVAEWTITGSDPMYIVVGGSFNDDKAQITPDSRDFYHATLKTPTLGLRLILYPETLNKH